MNPHSLCQFAAMILNFHAVNYQAASTDTSAIHDDDDSDSGIFRVKRRPSNKSQKRSIGDTFCSGHQGQQVCAIFLIFDSFFFLSFA